jgi:hypothetical protein
MGVYPVAVLLQKCMSHKITHRPQTKHSTQIYTHSEGPIVHNKYDTHTHKSEAIPVTGRGGADNHNSIFRMFLLLFILFLFLNVYDFYF